MDSELKEPYPRIKVAFRCLGQNRLKLVRLVLPLKISLDMV